MLSLLLTLAAAAGAAPVQRAAGPTDVQILNYALTLEHLENNFYKIGLSNFTSEDFQRAGTSKNFYNNLKEIATDEQTHVDFLSGALGSAATKACTYSFPVTDAASFLTVASILEGVGVSAYLGAAQYIANKDYLEAAGAILTVEGRHSAYIRDNNGASPFPSPFDIPLDFDEVYSLAAQFITACPSSNPKLPVKAFPAVSAAPGTPAKVGDKITLTVASSVNAKGAFFITTTGPVSAVVSGSGKTYTITIPKGVQSGQEYVVLTADTNKPTDDNIVAGPAIVAIADSVQGLKSVAPSATPSSYHSSAPSPPAATKPAAAPAPPAHGAPVSQIPDGQVQAHPPPVQEMPDGQPIMEIGDGQIQNPA